MNRDELDKVLGEHQKWINQDGGKRADLGGANLCMANLNGANLRGAKLNGANLYEANLGGADLWGANLGGANLGGANLGGANLGGADLFGADLRGADLRGANLRGANLYEAKLGGANLRGAKLRGANLSGAKGIVHIQLASFDMWVMSDWAIIGCREMTPAEWLAVSEDEAARMGLERKYFKGYRMMLQAAVEASRSFEE